MHEPDLEKLRKFSLTIALVILTYSIAGISIVPDASISLLGLAFKISRPELLPIGLVIASLYGMMRFYYYGFMIKKSPFRIRRDIINELTTGEPEFISGEKVPMYWGPHEFETSLWYSEREKVESYVAKFPDAFPKLGRARASVEIIYEKSYDEEGEPRRSYAVKVIIPKRCKFAALFGDVDFVSPILLNIFALIAIIYRFITVD